MKLSIITINRNNAQGLKATMESVLSQSSYDFEYIIIDGASTDGSKELIEQLAIKDKRLSYWCSEPDAGIYNAMNKGIKQAKGDYCLFLNSGDSLIDGNVVGDFVNESFTSDIVSGILCEDTVNGKLRVPPCRNEIDFEYFYLDTLPHPSTFIKRNLFDEICLYNEKNKVVSDWEFFLIALVLKNKVYMSWDRKVSVFDMSGISSNKENNEFEAAEKISTMKKILPLVYKTYMKQQEEINILKLHEERYEEYMRLRSSKFLFIIRILLWFKRKFSKR